MIDGAQQCSVLQVISCDIDGIIHRQVLLLRGVQMSVLFVIFVLRGLLYQVVEVFTKSGIPITSYTFLLRRLNAMKRFCICSL